MISHINPLKIDNLHNFLYNVCRCLMLPKWVFRFKEVCFMSKTLTLQEANDEILRELREVAKISTGRDQIIYLVKNPHTNEMEYSICGGAPLIQGIVSSLNNYNMYDIINALFANNLGYDVTVGDSNYKGVICVKMWHKD